MKKIVLFLCGLLLICGCSKSSEKYSEEKLALYRSYYNAVLENTTFEEYSRYFNLSSEVTQKDDGSWLYYIFVDTPQIAMYDVEMIVLEGLNDYSDADMYPSFGIFDDTEYNMIPYQVNAEKGYVKGIVTSGDLQDINQTLYVMVAWKDLTRLNQSREFFEVRLKTDQNSNTPHEAEPETTELPDDEEAEG